MSDKLELQAQRVLIIDDTPANIGVLADYLADYGLEVLVAQDGLSGVEKAESVMPDVILLDVMMPGIDGFETCQLLKKQPRTAQIPIIFMTALSEPEHKVKAFAVGAVDYVTKPLHQEEVLARVKTHLQIRAQAQALEAQAESLRAMNVSKDKFFSIVAHDLKGPFLPLLGNLELMTEIAEGVTTQDIREMSAASYRSARRVYELLENLLHWARLQMGHMEYQPHRVDLAQIVAKNMELLHDNATAKQITLHNQIEAKSWVYVDENMLDTVIRNLTSNALKFTGVGGVVSITAHPVGEFMEIAVTDTGAGMSREVQAKLFRIDRHVTTMGTGKETGTGLGLIICQEMVEKGGGRIWVESEVGQGTTARFTVKLA